MSKLVMKHLQHYWWKLMLCIVALSSCIFMRTQKTRKTQKNRYKNYFNVPRVMAGLIRRMTNWEMRRTLVIDTLPQSAATFWSLVLLIYVFKLLRRKTYNRNRRRCSGKNFVFLDRPKKAPYQSNQRLSYPKRMLYHLKCLVTTVHEYDGVQHFLKCWSCVFPVLYMEHCFTAMKMASGMIQRQLLLLAGDVELNPGPYDPGNSM